MPRTHKSKNHLITGDNKVTQSNAILRYIARKNDLLGKTEEERIRVDILAEQSMDFRNGLVRLSYNQNFVSAKIIFMSGQVVTMMPMPNFNSNYRSRSSQSISPPSRESWRSSRSFSGTAPGSRESRSRSLTLSCTNSSTSTGS